MAPDLFAGLYLVEKPKKVVGGEVKKEGESNKNCPPPQTWPCTARPSPFLDNLVLIILIPT